MHILKDVLIAVGAAIGIVAVAIIVMLVMAVRALVGRSGRGWEQ